MTTPPITAGELLVGAIGNEEQALGRIVLRVGEPCRIRQDPLVFRAAGGHHCCTPVEKLITFEIMM
nr:hypothetical protein [Streptomyces griseosporeus]